MKHLLLTTACLMSFASFANADNFKTSHQYACISKTDSYHFVLTVNLNNVDSKIQVQQNFADVDRSYNGAPKSLRFVYEESDEGVSEAIVQSSLVNGTPSGMLAIQTHGEDNTRVVYSCTIIR